MPLPPPRIIFLLSSYSYTTKQKTSKLFFNSPILLQVLISDQDTIDDFFAFIESY